MKTKINKLPKSQVEIFIELSVEEVEPFIEKTVKFLGEETDIPGFRRGHIPNDILKKHVGEMTLYERALPHLVNKTYFQALKDMNIEAIGQPDIEVIKMAPGNALEYKAITSVLPQMELGDMREVRIPQTPIQIEEKEIEDALASLQKMQSKEVSVIRELQENDRALLDMDIFLEGVPIEGGQARDHSIYLKEKYFVSGFKEKILGMKVKEERDFLLNFSEEHFQKNLAGHEVLFKVRLKQVFEITPPELNDEFAQTLGQKTLNDLSMILRKNIEHEKLRKDRETLEKTVLEKLVSLSSFDDIPDILINTEIEKMINELQSAVSREGVQFDDYLKNINKTVSDLKLDFISGAIFRIKSALASRAYANKENIEVTEEEIDKEINTLKEYYKDDQKTQKNIESFEHRSYLRNLLRNRKAIDKLVEVMAHNEKSSHEKVT